MQSSTVDFYRPGWTRFNSQVVYEMPGSAMLIIIRSRIGILPNQDSNHHVIKFHFDVMTSYHIIIPVENPMRLWHLVNFLLKHETKGRTGTGTSGRSRQVTVYMSTVHFLRSMFHQYGIHNKDEKILNPSKSLQVSQR